MTITNSWQHSLKPRLTTMPKKFNQNYETRSAENVGNCYRVGKTCITIKPRNGRVARGSSHRKHRRTRTGTKRRPKPTRSPITRRTSPIIIIDYEPVTTTYTTTATTTIPPPTTITPDYVDCIDCDDNFAASYIESEAGENEEYYDGHFYETESHFDQNQEKRRTKERKISTWKSAF